jgi:hypothetical protein
MSDGVLSKVLSSGWPSLVATGDVLCEGTVVEASTLSSVGLEEEVGEGMRGLPLLRLRVFLPRMTWLRMNLRVLEGERPSASEAMKANILGWAKGEM